MKIRIKSNSLRYRLTRSDVAKLTSEHYLEDKVNFGNRALVYALKLALPTVYPQSSATIRLRFACPKI